MGREDAQKILGQEIRDDARRRADSAVNAARAAAEKLVAEATAKSAAETEQSLAEAADRAQRRALMLLRTADQEIARRKLIAREEIVQEAIAQARAQLQALDGAQYRQAVARLAAEAIERMPGRSFIVRADGMTEADARGLTDELATALREKGRSVSIQFQPGRAGSKGAIVESSDGTMRWDNTFEARMQRFEDRLRRLIAPMLFEVS